MRAACVLGLALATAACGPPITSLATLKDRRLDAQLKPGVAKDVVLLEITVQSKDHVAGCLALDPETEIRVGSKKFSLGTPSSPDDDCPPVSLLLDVHDDEIDLASPAQIRVSDDTMTMQMRVPQLFATRQLHIPVFVYSCSTLELSYSPADEHLSSVHIGFSSLPPDSDPQTLDNTLAFATDASQLDASNIRASVPSMPRSAHFGGGTLVVETSAKLPTEACEGATACTASAETRFDEAATLVDGCS